MATVGLDYEPYELVSQFLEDLEYVDDDEVKVVLKDITQICRQFVSKHDNDEKSIEELKRIAKNSYENLVKLCPFI